MPLDETISAGQAGHITDHQTVHEFINDHPTDAAAHSGTTVEAIARYRSRPTVVLGESMPRTGHIANVAPLTSGNQTFVLVWLEAGTLVTNVAFMSATTAATTPTNQWFSLYDASRNKIAVTADDTTTAWAANTLKTLALSSAYPVTASAYFYLGIMVAAATVPTLFGAATRSPLSGLAPVLAGVDTTNTGLTTPATAPAVATISTANVIAYGHVT